MSSRYNEEDRRRMRDYGRQPRFGSQDRSGLGRGREFSRDLRDRDVEREQGDYDRWDRQQHDRSYRGGYEPGYGMSYRPSSRTSYPEGGEEQFGRRYDQWDDRRRFQDYGRRSRLDYPRNYRQSFGTFSEYDRDDYNTGSSPYYGQSGERGWWERVSDEVASWFGDEEAERRRRMDETRMGSHRGKGPRGYKRSDERIREDVNDRLTDYDALDASDIEVTVNEGNVILSGTVGNRWAKRLAEDIVETVSGVNDVQNNLRVGHHGTETTVAKPELHPDAATKTKARGA